MIKTIVRASLLGLIFSTISCGGPYATDDLVGEWQATELSEEGDSLKVNTNDVRFTFSAAGRYQYFSTLNYQESGLYKIDGKYLLSTDTTRAGQAEKAVEIVKLINDSLVIKMKDQGKERLMVL
ncbi:MAG: lipocalin family protein, partial [Bacteroidota bacterium]